MWLKVLLILPLLASVRVSAECIFDGVAYPVEAMAPTCLVLVCSGDTWVATGESHGDCDPCSGHNDPHWLNFDGFYFDFHGTCNYSVAVNKDSGVYGDFKQCNNFASCFNIITYKDGPHTVITMNKDDGNSILVNGDSFTVDGVVRAVQSSGPTTHGVLAWKPDANCIRIVGTRGISLSYCGWALYVWAASGVVGGLSGLCTSNHSFNTFGLIPGGYTPLPASYDEINEWGHSLRTTGDNCTLDPNFIASGGKPTQGRVAFQRQKRAVSSLPSFCRDEASFINECQDLFSFVGDAGNPHMIQMYTEFCMIDLCAMWMSSAMPKEVAEWKETMVVMLKTTIEAVVNVQNNSQVIQEYYG